MHRLSTTASIRKRHQTARQRGGRLWVERRTNAWAGVVGFLTGRGHSSEAIAAQLADGTTDGTIRKAWERWGIAPENPFAAHLTVPVGILERAHIAARAEQNGMSIEQYCHDIIVAASMPRDRYRDLVAPKED